MYPYELEKGSRKSVCPGCGKKTFTRTVATTSGSYLPAHVGRCDREANCGYLYTWKQYFTDHPDARDGSCGKQGTIRRVSRRGILQKVKRPEYLDLNLLLGTLTDYDRNTLVNFLMALFPDDSADVYRVVKDYLIGTRDGYTVFPTISRTGRVCKAKLMKFDTTTGKRIKGEYSISSLEAKLKQAGRLKEDFETDKNVFFGEHLLSKYPGLPVAIVESEKSAVIASLCRGAFPTLLWLAAGSLSWLNAERLERIGRDLKIILYPDADKDGKCFLKWQSIASEARKRGVMVKVSNLIENYATADEKAKGYDLADYLIHEQARRNDPALQGEFRTLIEERLAILTIDGGMTEKQAEDHILETGFYDGSLRDVLR